MNRTTGAPPRARLFSRLRSPIVVDRTTGARRVAIRRAVRALVWGAAAFVLATAALSASVETALPQVRDPEYGERLVRFRAQQSAHPNRPAVLVLGTSRTQNAIDPLAMGFPDDPGSPLVFNFGHSGVRPLQLRLILWRLHAAAVRPAAVLVEVFPGHLGEVGPDDPVLRDAAQLTAADVAWLAPHVADPAALRRRWARNRLEPWTEYRGALIARCAPEALPWALRIDHLWTTLDPHGFNGYPPGRVTEESRARARERMRRTYGAVLGDLRVSADTDGAYRGLVADCRARGVPVAFYLAPESPAFRGWYAPASRAALAEFTRRLSAELGCPVFDAPTDFAEEDFADGHHILSPAAARFSRELADRHLTPWLAESLK